MKILVKKISGEHDLVALLYKSKGNGNIVNTGSNHTWINSILSHLKKNGVTSGGLIA